MEVPEATGAEHTAEAVGDRARDVPERAVRRLVRGRGVDERRPRHECGVEHSPDRGGVVLAVFVHRDDPVCGRTRHPCECCRVLSEVACEPDRANLGVAAGEQTDRLIGVIRPAVVDEDDLADAELVAQRRSSRLGVRVQLVDEHRERVLPAVDRDHDRNAVRGAAAHVARAHRCDTPGDCSTMAASAGMAKS